MSVYFQGAKVRTNIPPTQAPLPSRDVLDKINHEARNEAYRFAIANKKRSWAVRWLKSEGYAR